MVEKFSNCDVDTERMWEQRDWENLGQFEYRHQWGETDLNAGGADDWSLRDLQRDSFETEKKRPFMRPIAMHRNAKSSLFTLPSENTSESMSKETNGFRAAHDISISINTKSDSCVLEALQNTNDIRDTNGISDEKSGVESSMGIKTAKFITDNSTSKYKPNKSTIPDRSPSFRRDRAESLDTSDFVDTQDTNPDDSSLDTESSFPFVSAVHTLSYQSILQQHVNLALRRIYFYFFFRFQRGGL